MLSNWFSLKENMKRTASLHYSLFSCESCSKERRISCALLLGWKVTLKSEMRNIIVKRKVPLKQTKKLLFHHV